MPSLTINGHSVTVDDSFDKLSPEEQNATVDHIAKELHGSEKPSGAGAGFAQGVSGLAGGVASTLGLGGVNSDTLKNIASDTAPKDYKAAHLIREGGHWYNPSDYQPSAIPQVLAEQAPGLATDYLAGKTGAAVGSKVGGVRGAVVGGVGGSLGSMLLRTFGPGAHANAEARTGDANAEVNGSDMLREGGKQLVQAPLNALGASKLLGLGSKATGVGLEGAGNALKKYLGTVGAETAAGGGRDVVNQLGTSVGQEHGNAYDPNQTAEAALASGAGSGVLVAPRLAGKLHNSSKYSEFGGDNAAASEALANRQIKAADGKDLVGSLGGTKTAAEAVNAAHADVHTELQAASKGLDLSQENANTLKRIKDGGTANKKELAALDAEAPDEVTHLARQALLSAKLKDMGTITDKKFTGGLSGAMENLSPISSPVKTLAAASAAGLVGHAAGLGLMGTYGLPAIAGITGGYAGARILDKLTGARSPAKGFTDTFANPEAPIRTPVPQAPVPEPMSTSVPQVNAPSAPAQPWGAPAPAPEAPVAPQLSPVAMSMLKQKLKEGLPAPEEPAAAPAPAAPVDAFDALKPLMGRQRAIMRGLASANKQQMADNAAQRKAAGIAQAEGLAEDSPAIQEQGGLSALSNPEFTKRGAQLLSAASVMRRLTAQPEADATPPAGPASPQIAQAMQTVASHAGGLPPQAPPVAPAPPAPPAPAPAPQGGLPPQKTMADILKTAMAPQAPQAPQAPMIAKINKKLNGKVEETPHPEADQPYVPLPEEALYRKMMTDKEMTDHEFETYSPSKKKAYAEKAVNTREGNRDDTLGATAEHSPEDRAVAKELYHQLDHTKTPAQARKAVAHYTARMSPKAAAAVNAKFTPEVIAFRWKDKK